MKKKTESQEQQKLIMRLRWHHKDLPFFAIPNGGKRNQGEARRMVLEGVEKGTPDIFIAKACGKYHGLFLELKRADGGTVSSEQLEKIKVLLDEGYRVEICHGAEEAYKVILDYIEEKI